MKHENLVLSNESVKVDLYHPERCGKLKFRALALRKSK